MTPSGTARVWRYSIPVTGKPQTLVVPAGHPLLVACRHPDVVDIWLQAEVDERLNVLNVLRRTFKVVPTGGRIPDRGWHVGSCLAAEGRLVWHLYELPAGGGAS